jgi:hypothetical protein
MFRGAAAYDFGQSIQFVAGHLAPGVSPDATVDTNDQPVTEFLVRTIGKRRPTAHGAHQVANIVITGNAMNAKVERQQEIAEAFVRFRGVVLDEIASHNDAIGTPVRVLVMSEHTGKRRLRIRATQFTVEVGK